MRFQGRVIALLLPLSVSVAKSERVSGNPVKPGEWLCGEKADCSTTKQIMDKKTRAYLGKLVDDIPETATFKSGHHIACDTKHPKLGLGGVCVFLEGMKKPTASAHEVKDLWGAIESQTNCTLCSRVKLKGGDSDDSGYLKVDIVFKNHHCDGLCKD